MNWTRPQGLRAQVQKLWDKGELLAGLITDEPLFPKRLILKCPSSTEMSTHFEEVRAWIAQLRTVPYCRIEMRQVAHRVLGNNAVPHEA